MNNKTDQIKSAIEKTVGHKLDAFLVLGANKETGFAFQFGEGELALFATLIADLYKRHPQLEQMVKDAQQLHEGKLPDDLVKALFKILGGNNND